jgi:hypothetical protein
VWWGSEFAPPALGHSSLETMTQKPYKTEGFTHHTPWVEDGKVFLSNDEDGYYVEEFKSRAELDTFIEQLHTKAEEAWPN